MLRIGRKPRRYISEYRYNKPALENELKFGNSLYFMQKLRRSKMYFENKVIKEIIRRAKRIDNEYPSMHQLIDLETVNEIKDWCNQNYRRPNVLINDMDFSKKTENMTEQERETFYAILLMKFTKKYLNKYTENEFDRKIAGALQDIKSTELLKLEEINKWCAVHGWIPRKEPKTKNNKEISDEEELEFEYGSFIESLKNKYSSIINNLSGGKLPLDKLSEDNNEIVEELQAIITKYPVFKVFEIIQKSKDLNNLTINNNKNNQER